MLFKLNQWPVAPENTTLFRVLISLLYKVTYNTKRQKSVNMSMMHLFFAKNENSLPGLFKVLGLYEPASDAKMNKLKTQGLFIGSLKGKSSTYKKIKWTSTYVQTLGVHHRYNIDLDDIWRNKINKIKSCLQVWKSRDLTVQGNVLLTKLTFTRLSHTNLKHVIYRINTVTK